MIYVAKDGDNKALELRFIAEVAEAIGITPKALGVRLLKDREAQEVHCKEGYTVYRSKPEGFQIVEYPLKVPETKAHRAGVEVALWSIEAGHAERVRTAEIADYHEMSTRKVRKWFLDNRNTPDPLFLNGKMYFQEKPTDEEIKEAEQTVNITPKPLPEKKHGKSLLSSGYEVHGIGYTR